MAKFNAIADVHNRLRGWGSSCVAGYDGPDQKFSNAREMLQLLALRSMTIGEYRKFYDVIKLEDVQKGVWYWTQSHEQERTDSDCVMKIFNVERRERLFLDDSPIRYLFIGCVIYPLRMAQSQASAMFAGGQLGDNLDLKNIYKSFEWNIDAGAELVALTPFQTQFYGLTHLQFPSQSLTYLARQTARNADNWMKATVRKIVRQ